MLASMFVCLCVCAFVCLFVPQLTQLQFGWRLRRHPEDDEGEQTQQCTRQHQNECVERHLAAQGQSEGQVGIRLIRATRVILDVPLGVILQDVPLIADDKVAQVEGMLRDEIDVELVAVVGPRTELEVTRLHVKWEVLGVEGARGAEDGLGHPERLPLAAHYHQRVSLLPKAIVSTASHHDTLTLPAGVAYGTCNNNNYNNDKNDDYVYCFVPFPPIIKQQNEESKQSKQTNSHTHIETETESQRDRKRQRETLK